MGSMFGAGWGKPAIVGNKACGICLKVLLLLYDHLSPFCWLPSLADVFLIGVVGLM